MLCLTCVIAVLTLANVAFVAYSVQPPQWITPSAHNGRVISSQSAIPSIGRS
jgi:hypothetical protein